MDSFQHLPTNPRFLLLTALMRQRKAASKTDACPVLQEIARIRSEDPDDGLFKSLTKCGLAVSCPAILMQLDDSFTYPCFHPRDILVAMGKKGFVNNILGEHPEEVERTLTDFWMRFRRIKPGHELFETQEDWSHMFPYFFHGDGGRTYKKDPILVCSMFNALGGGTRKATAPIAPQPRKRKYSGMSSSSESETYVPGVNLLGRSLTTRALFTAMKAEFYKNKRLRFEPLVDLWGQYLADLYHVGFELNGKTWKVAVLGITGDAPFLREIPQPQLFKLEEVSYFNGFAQGNMLVVRR